MAGEPIIQTTDLSETFRALRNRDPLKVSKQSVPNHPDYPRIPDRNYGPIATVNTGNWGNGMTRYASGSGVIYGQPQFFSPVHTPINWQIPSRRLEQYQWCVTPWTRVLCSDFTYKEIIDIQIGDEVLTHDGTFKPVEKIGERPVDEEIYKISVQGERDDIEITGNHKMYCVRKEDVSCKHKLKNKRPQRCTPLFGIPCATYKKQSLPKCNIQELKISHIPSSEVRENDYLLFPVPKVVRENSEINENRARLLGYYAAEGCCRNNPSNSQYMVQFTLNIDEKETLAKEIVELLNKEFDCHAYTYVWPKRPNTLNVKVQSIKALNFFKKYCPGLAVDKKFSEEVLYLPFELQKHVIACYVSGDGHFKIRDNNILEVSVCSASEELLEQVRIMLCRGEIITTAIYDRICKIKYKGIVKEFDSYSLSFSKFSLNKIGNIFCGENFVIEDYNSKNNNMICDGYVLKRVVKVEKEKYCGNVHNIEVKDNHSYVVNGCVVHNCRFFYTAEPKVASAIDFYSTFPVSDWVHECKDRKVQLYFDALKKRLNLTKWVRLMSHEIHLLGDCFPFSEVSCELCSGTGRVGDEVCEHEGGTIRRLVILNPDFIEVYTSPLNPDPVVVMKPDEELLNMVQKKTPGYDRLSPEVIKLISAGQPIRLDNRNVQHLKYGESGYTTWGISMVRRLFPILSYKTKLMVAQWIVAERLIVPIKVVKVGSDLRPAGPADIAAVQSQLSMTANDPNLTIVTHHNFELDWFGAAGKVLTLSNEFEFINQEILDGMMINNALLNGEGPSFSSASVGIEAMIQRLETFRDYISQWIENSLYLPEAKRQGFIDTNPETGEEEYIVPTIKWNKMHLRDQQQDKQFAMSLYEKGLLSAQTMLEIFGYDPDMEIERKRYDYVQMMALGQGLGQQGGGAGGAGGGGGMGGGGGGPLGDLGGGGGGEPPISPPGGGGDMGGATGGAPAAPTGGAPVTAKSTTFQTQIADPGQFGGRILKKKTREKIMSERAKTYSKMQNSNAPAQGGQTRDAKGRIMFTKPERELIGRIMQAQKEGVIRYRVDNQYPVKMVDREYPLDFAIPQLKIGIEADGEIFHSAPKQKQHDQERDMKLAQAGWTIVRFSDSEIEKRPAQVISTIVKTIMQKEMIAKQMMEDQPRPQA